MKNSTARISAFLAACAAAFSMSAHADDWGCEVLLCVSNPAGPMAVAECVPPIQKLYRELAKGHAFPSCAMSGGEGQNYATNQYQPIPECPSNYPYDRGLFGRQGEPMGRTCGNGKIERVCHSGGNQGGCQDQEQTITMTGDGKYNVIKVYIDGKLNNSFRW